MARAAHKCMGTLADTNTAFHGSPPQLRTDTRTHTHDRLPLALHHLLVRPVPLQLCKPTAIVEKHRCGSAVDTTEEWQDSPATLSNVEILPTRLLQQRVLNIRKAYADTSRLSSSWQRAVRRTEAGTIDQSRCWCSPQRLIGSPHNRPASPGRLPS